MTKRKITIDNVRKVRHFDLEFEKPGILVVTGKNGSGKSTVLDCVTEATGGGGKKNLDLEPTKDPDFAPSQGTITDGSATIKINRARRTKSGSSDLIKLGGRFNITKLVNPGIDNKESADLARMKTLVQITGAVGRDADYYELIGGKEAYEELGIEYSENPVLLASRVKAACDKKATEQKRISDKLRSQVNVELQDVDMDSEDDEEALREAYYQARLSVERLEDKKTHAEKGARDYQESKLLLDARKADYDGKSVDQCAQELDLAEAICVADEETIAKIRTQLELAEKRLANSVLLRAEARSDLKEAEKFVEHCAELEAVIEKGEPVQVSRETLTNARMDMDIAQGAERTGEVIRQNKRLMRQSEEKREELNDAVSIAAKWRSRAQRTSDVLTSLLPKDCPLRFRGGRLVIATERDEHELLSDLSDGQMCKIAITIAADSMPPEGILVIDQPLWEGLGDTVRAEMDEHVAKLGIFAVTARVDDGYNELKALEVDHGGVSVETAGH